MMQFLAFSLIILIPQLLKLLGMFTLQLQLILVKVLLILVRAQCRERSFINIRGSIICSNLNILNLSVILFKSTLLKIVLNLTAHSSRINFALFLNFLSMLFFQRIKPQSLPPMPSKSDILLRKLKHLRNEFYAPSRNLIISIKISIIDKSVMK